MPKRRKRLNIRRRVKLKKINTKLLSRKKEIKFRKNFFLIFILNLISVTSLIYIILFVEPESFMAIPMFFLLVFIFLYFTFLIVFTHPRKSLIFACSVTLFIFLRYIGVGNLLNFTIISGLTFIFITYISGK